MSAATKISFTTLFFLGFLLSGSDAAMLTIKNKCSYKVWPAILSAAGTWPLPTTGFALQPGESNSITVPPTWSGQLWGRTLCSHDMTGKFSCVTGDCGLLECAGRNAVPPVTLVEFTLNNNDGLDYFDVSLRDGFNLPVRVEPRGGTGAGNCRAIGCGKDLNRKCPIELKVIGDGERVVACKGACQAGACNSPSFSQFFKSKCPDAYDHVSFTCASADYTIIFCPASSKSSKKKEKKSPVENSGGHVGSSLYVLKLFIKNVMPFVAVPVSFLIIFRCVCFACRTWYRSPNRQWGTEMVVGRTCTTAETLARNPQHVNVEMVNS